MAEKEQKVKSRIDLHCHSNFGAGKDSVLRLYNQAINQKLTALVIADKYPAVGFTSGKMPFYEINEFLLDLKQLKKDGWKQKIPIIVGMEYTWPEWLIGGFSVKTLVFGSKAIDQLLGLERYRKVDGVDRAGNILKQIHEKAEIIPLNISEGEQFQLIRYESGESVIKRFNNEKNRWVTTSLQEKEIPLDVYGEKTHKEMKRMIKTGETLSEVWRSFEIALTHKLVENEDGILEEKGGIDSAIILCSPDANQIRPEKNIELIASLPKYFLNIIDSVEVSYGGLSKKKENTNYSLIAYQFANSINALPVLSSDALQAEMYGKEAICNEFSIEIKSENDLIKAILDKDVIKQHNKNIEDFCKRATESKEAIVQDGSLIFATGAGDEF